MAEYADFSLQVWFDQVNSLIRQQLFTVNTARQMLIIGVAVLLAYILTRIIKGVSLPTVRQHWGEESLGFSLAQKAANLVLPLLTALLLEAMVIAYSWEMVHRHLLIVSAHLAWTWLLVRLIASFLTKGVASRFLMLIIFVLLALRIFGLSEPLAEFLDRFGIKTDNFRISLLTIFKGGVLAAFLLMFVSYFCNFLEKYLPHSSNLTPRVQILVLKTARLVLVTLAVIIALDSVGLDFYLISVFSGALGLGLGFGL